jgi:ribosome-associated protein
MKTVIINQQPVELYKVLKFEGMVGSGGEAKNVIADGLVRVNREVETRKRKKLVSGDVIEFGSEKIVLQMSRDSQHGESEQ